MCVAATLAKATLHALFEKQNNHAAPTGSVSYACTAACQVWYLLNDMFFFGNSKGSAAAAVVVGQEQGKRECGAPSPRDGVEKLSKASAGDGG